MLPNRPNLFGRGRQKASSEDSKKKWRARGVLADVKTENGCISHGPLSALLTKKPCLSTENYTVGDGFLFVAAQSEKCRLERLGR